MVVLHRPGDGLCIGRNGNLPLMGRRVLRGGWRRKNAIGRGLQSSPPVKAALLRGNLDRMLRS